MSILMMLGYALAITIPLFGIGYLIFRLVYNDLKPHLNRKIIMDNRINIGEVFVSIDFIIKTETDLFERYFENNTNQEFTSLTNSEFTNIYNELSMRCLKAVSPLLWEISEIYMDRTEVQTYITQRVMDFLLDRSTVTDEDEE